jgi:hypothetical protein
MTSLFGCISKMIGEMPFTYLGLPLGLARPKKEHYLPLIQRIQKRLSCSSNFLSQAGRLELVNSIFSALPTFFMCTLKIPKTIIKKIDRSRKHCLWRGDAINSKKPQLIAWNAVTQRKVNGGLGVLRLETQNEALLIKFLHKFFNHSDLPWVHLIWNKYYLSRGLPGHRNIGSFWWKSMIKLLPNFKGLASPVIGNGGAISFWDDQWSQCIPRQNFPELFSFAKNTKLTIKEAKEQEQFDGFFHLPISEQAYDQYLVLKGSWEQLVLSDAHDRWQYIWGSDKFSSQKAYRFFMGQTQIHPIYRLLWKSKCQPKHRVFYWLWLKNRLNTRDMLRRRNMELDSYSCENCLWQREETLYHLFLRCNFAKACWSSIGITPPRISNPEVAAANLNHQLNVPFSMEIIILMTWSIWKSRNEWLFSNKDPSVHRCTQEFSKELRLIMHRAQGKFDTSIPNWLNLWQA